MVWIQCSTGIFHFAVSGCLRFATCKRSVRLLNQTTSWQSLTSLRMLHALCSSLECSFDHVGCNMNCQEETQLLSNGFD